LCVAASLVVTVSPLIETASAATREDPRRYRYAGVVENGLGVPMHYLRRGGGITFAFSDALSLGRKALPYRLCLGRPRRTPNHCWDRTARYGVGKVSFSATLPPDVPLGALTAHWFVAGRIVASWPFLYVRSE
jgi:hypothetical protein